MAKVYNKSSQLVESAKWLKCPRCKGFGSNYGDEDNCDVCNGHGSVWITGSGWTRAKYSRESKLY